MKFNKKIIVSVIGIFVLINICCLLYTQVFAGVGVEDVISSMNTTTLEVPTIVATVLHWILAVVQVGIVGFFTIYLTLLGIKYFMVVSSGNPEEESKLKKKLSWAIFLGVLAFGAVSFIRLIYNLVG
jgi:hypothetical protein